jgi:hypothetical protein
MVPLKMLITEDVDVLEGAVVRLIRIYYQPKLILYQDFKIRIPYQFNVDGQEAVVVNLDQIFWMAMDVVFVDQLAQNMYLRDQDEEEVVEYLDWIFLPSVYANWANSITLQISLSLT